MALGGALFLASDLMIGLGAAGVDFPGHDVLVMSTYAAALFLIATGWRRPSPRQAEAVPILSGSP